MRTEAELRRGEGRKMIEESMPEEEGIFEVSMRERRREEREALGGRKQDGSEKEQVKIKDEKI